MIGERKTWKVNYVIEINFLGLFSSALGVEHKETILKFVLSL